MKVVIDGRKVKAYSRILRQRMAGYWQLSRLLLCIAVTLPHTHSWSDWLRSHPPRHGHTHLFLGSSSLQSPCSDTRWFDLKEHWRDKWDDGKLQLLRTMMDGLWPQIVPTVAGLPHVTAGAARRAAHRPVACAVLSYHVLLPHTLQCMHFAHSQRDGFSTGGSGGTHIQRWAGDKNHIKSSSKI